MSSSDFHNDTTAAPTTAHVITTTTTTQWTSTAFITNAVSWINTSNNTLGNATSPEPGPNSKRQSEGESQEHIAIICGVVFGVLGLAISLVALYIITRKIKERRTANRHAELQMKESGSKPYESVEKDFDSVHDYREIEQPISALSMSGAAEKSAREASSHSNEAYENTDAGSMSMRNNTVSNEHSEEYESITIPSDKRSKDYIEMHVTHPNSNHSSTTVDHQSESALDSNPPNHKYGTNESSYVNMNDIVFSGSNTDNRLGGKEEETYANTSTAAVANGQNGYSQTAKPEMTKINIKKDKYDVSKDISADQKDITYKF